MTSLDKNYINKLKLPDTNTIVIINGIFQDELSDKCVGVVCQQPTIKVAANVTLAKPIHLLFLTTQNCNYTIDITAEKNSCFTLITEHVDLVSSNSVNNIKINITAKNNSNVTYYKLQNEHSAVTHNAQTIIIQEQNSKVNSGFVGQGSKTSDEILNVRLAGKSASYNSLGIISLQNNQTLNYKARIEHLVPNCTSKLLFKGVVADKAAGTFDCLVVAHPKAIKTQTHVTNKNLLLTDTATMNTSPQLEIYTDDVICTHGATVGQLDWEALFYLRSRGLTKEMATQLLIQAFTQEIIDQFTPILQTKNNYRHHL